MMEKYTIENINSVEALVLGILIGLLLAVMSMLISEVGGRK